MKKEQHYFASTCYFWVTAQTVQGVIAKMQAQYKSEEENIRKRASVLIHLVPLEESAAYDIDFYRPQVEGVKLVASEKLFPELQGDDDE
jgi:hypothetical protein